jgi:formate dehydrogenase subunit gamma
VLISSIVVHIYAAIWVKGSIGAMTSGKVSRAWARKHHKLWYDEMRKKER